MDHKSVQKKQIIIWVDGCFDGMHFGHANALRQAKELGDYLIVGVHSDKEIRRVKGPPVMNEEERYQAVRACKWVDEVVEDAPYSTELDMINKYNVDWVVHGDDLCVDANGVDAYEAIKKANKFKVVKRTPSISTTDILNRILSQKVDESIEHPFPKKFLQHLPSCQKIKQFTTSKEPKDSDRIVWVDGVFDLFNIGHVEFLREAKKLGDYLILGVHDDQTAEFHKGKLPIMNLHERVLGALCTREADDVVIGSPYIMTKEMIETLKISVVVCGSTRDESKSKIDPYEVPKKMGIFKEIKSPRSYLTTTLIIDRILKNYQEYQERNEKKMKK